MHVLNVRVPFVKFLILVLFFFSLTSPSGHSKQNIGYDCLHTPPASVLNIYLFAESYTTSPPAKAARESTHPLKDRSTRSVNSTESLRYQCFVLDTIKYDSVLCLFELSSLKWKKINYSCWKCWEGRPTQCSCCHFSRGPPGYTRVATWYTRPQ